MSSCQKTSCQETSCLSVDAVNPEKDVDLDIVDSIKARDNILSKRLEIVAYCCCLVKYLKILSHRQNES